MTAAAVGVGAVASTRSPGSSPRGSDLEGATRRPRQPRDRPARRLPRGVSPRTADGIASPWRADCAPDLVVVGPEAPLVAGLDALRRRRRLRPSSGPSREAARKPRARTLRQRTGAHRRGRPDGGPRRRADLHRLSSRKMGSPPASARTLPPDRRRFTVLEAVGPDAFAEELLEGEELSLFALVAGTSVLACSAGSSSRPLRAR